MLTAHAAEVADALHVAVPDRFYDSTFLENQKKALQTLIEQQLNFSAEDQKLTLVLENVQAVPNIQSLLFHFHAAWEKVPGKIQMTSRLFPYDPNHETLMTVTEKSGGSVYQELLNSSHTSFDYYTSGRQGIFSVLKKFILAGMHHIFIGPDHILFILALLLAGGGWKKLVMIVTSFTVAHSITLALATLGWVEISSRTIEPLIALTVVGAGLRNLLITEKKHDGRASIAFGFGLIHGFGFASVLQDFGLPQQALGLSLFGFNAGVEVGQLCIVSAIVPLLFLLRTHNFWLSQKLIRYGSVAILLTGTFWFLERI